MGGSRDRVDGRRGLQEGRKSRLDLEEAGGLWPCRRRFEVLVVLESRREEGRKEMKE